MKNFKKILFLLFITSLVCSFFNLLSGFNVAFASEPVSKTDTVPSRNYTVLIDPGHGGFDVK